MFYECNILSAFYPCCDGLGQFVMVWSPRGPRKTEEAATSFFIFNMVGRRKADAGAYLRGGGCPRGHREGMGARENTGAHAADSARARARVATHPRRQARSAMRRLAAQRGATRQRGGVGALAPVPGGNVRVLDLAGVRVARAVRRRAHRRGNGAPRHVRGIGGRAAREPAPAGPLCAAIVGV